MGSKNLVKGNYATAMGWNALANQNLCMTIGLQLNTDKFVRANQVGDWVLRAERIELRVGAGALVLTKNNIKKFKSILKGTRRRRLEARSDEEQNLLTELEAKFKISIVIFKKLMKNYSKSIVINENEFVSITYILSSQLSQSHILLINCLH